MLAMAFGCCAATAHADALDDYMQNTSCETYLFSTPDQEQLLRNLSLWFERTYHHPFDDYAETRFNDHCVHSSRATLREAILLSSGRPDAAAGGWKPNDWRPSAN